MSVRLPGRQTSRRMLRQAAVGILSPRFASPSLVGIDVPVVRSVEPTADEDLATAIAAGDRNAEEELYRRYAPSVLGLATRLLRSHDEAMDVLQDTFVSAFRDIASLRDRSAFRGWIHRICVRLVHRKFRRRRLLALLGLHSGSGETSLESLADEAASPEARMELRWLDRALDDVNAAARAAWVLRNIEGYALEEVAQLCNCSLATAKRRIALVENVVAAHFGEGDAS